MTIHAPSSTSENSLTMSLDEARNQSSKSQRALVKLPLVFLVETAYIKSIIQVVCCNLIDLTRNGSVNSYSDAEVLQTRSIDTYSRGGSPTQVGWRRRSMAAFSLVISHGICFVFLALNIFQFRLCVTYKGGASYLVLLAFDCFFRDSSISLSSDSLSVSSFLECIFCFLVLICSSCFKSTDL